MYRYRASVTRVIDGDTIVAHINLGFGVWVIDRHFRLYGIDAPELSDAPAGPAAREELARLIMKHSLGSDTKGLPTVEIEMPKGEHDKYGRWLAVVRGVGEGETTVELNQVMVERGFAVPFACEAFPTQPFGLPL